MFKSFKRSIAPAGAIGQCPYCYAWLGYIQRMEGAIPCACEQTQRYCKGERYCCSGCRRFFRGEDASLY